MDNIIIFLLFGILYIILELIWRRRTHWTMFFIGGLNAYLIGYINEVIQCELWCQILIGLILTLIIEFISGLIINKLLKWNVWDYSSLKYNLMGQICLRYALLWIAPIYWAIWLDDFFRIFLKLV